MQFNGEKYGYVVNLQGDVVGFIDNTGPEVVKYVYDAWGKILSTTGSLASTLGTIQPFRYRGYVYDQETKLYYLRNRYYNVFICRFINSDNLMTNKSLFAYCSNKPTIMFDSNGTEERRSESSGDITNFVREGFFMVKTEYTLYPPKSLWKDDVVEYVLFIPYNYIQYFNNAVLFEDDNPINKLEINLINQVLSEGQDATAELLDDIFKSGRSFSFIMLALGLLSDFIDDTAASVKKADHHAAAQSATDKRSYMVVEIKKTTSTIPIRQYANFYSYMKTRPRFETNYYEISEYNPNLRE